MTRQQYLMGLYEYNSNAILAEPLKSCTDTTMVEAYCKLHDYSFAQGLKPCLQRLNNEASQALQAFMHDKDVTFQLVAPHVHQTNAAE
jgi:hypothetical protein